MTLLALRQCMDLERGRASAYVERDGERWCLPHAAAMYLQNPVKFASWQHIYLMEKEAREQQRARR
jgi:hypothetical protein